MKEKKRYLLLDKNLLIVFSVTLIAVMGVSSIMAGLPTIARELNVPIERVNLLIAVFTMPGMFLSLILGVMSDRMSRKKVLVPSLLVFGIAGIACGFTKDFSILLVLRFIQGAGAASIGSLNLTIIGDLFKGEERIRAMGYNGSVLSIAIFVYMIFGGALADLDWSYPFFLSGIAIPVALIVVFFLKSPEPENNQDLSIYFKNALSLVIKGNVIVLYLITLITFILIYGVLIAYFPHYMDVNFNASASTIGYIIAAASITTSLGAYSLGWLNKHFSTKKIIIFSFIIYGLSIGISMFIDNLYFLLIPVFLYGFGNGINIPSTQARIAESSSIDTRGALMSFNSTVLRAGQTLGPVIFAVIHGYMDVLGVFISAIGLSLITAIVLIFALKNEKQVY